jgi:hypothetical protein
MDGTSCRRCEERLILPSLSWAAQAQNPPARPLLFWLVVLGFELRAQPLPKEGPSSGTHEPHSHSSFCLTPGHPSMV